LRANGFDVTLLSAPGHVATNVAMANGVEHIGIEMKRHPAPMADIVALLRIIAAIRTYRPDIISAGTPKAGLLLMLAGWICRIPCRVYMLRGLRLETATGMRRRALALLERLCCTLAHYVVCVSPSLRQRMLDYGLAPANKLTVIGKGSSNGVDLARFSRNADIARRASRIRSVLEIPASATVVGFVGRLTHDKGIHVLAAAWRELRERYPDLYLVLVGGVEERDGAAQRTAGTLKRDPRARVIGRVEDIVPYYALMDILVLPTLREGFPNVVLEAAAMGLPVVTTTATGSRDSVLPGLTGGLVEPGDPTALSHAISRYVDDPAMRERHGRAGREMVETHFRQEHVWDGMVKYYWQILNKGGVEAATKKGDVSYDTHGCM